MAKTDKNYLKNIQYRDSSNFMARMKILEYGKHPQSPWQWLAEIYDFSTAQTILEVGCGNGLIWSSLANQLTAKHRVELTDLSVGMLDITKTNIAQLASPAQFKFSVQDLEQLPYPDHSFDVVLAHMLLYHFPDPKHAIKEISRVVNTHGWTGITTFDSTTSRAMYQLAHQLEPSIPAFAATIRSFTEEIALELLPSFFDQISTHHYTNPLHITDPQVVVDYIGSSAALKDLTNKTDFLDRYYSEVSHIINTQGSFNSDFNMVLFLCKRTKYQ